MEGEMEYFIELIRQMPVYIMGAILFYKIGSHHEELKYSATKTVVLLAMTFCIMRVIGSVFNLDGVKYIIMSTSIFLPVITFLYSAKRKRLQLGKGIFFWIIEYVYEWIVAKIISPWIWVEANMGVNVPEVDFIKLEYVAILFIGFTIYDILYQKRKEKVIRYIAVLNFTTGIVQIFLLKLCLEKNLLAEQNRISIVSFIFSLVLVMEYFLTIEVFRESLEQREKENELAQMKLKQKYEYDYYQFAQKQGEEIRDIRHDLRNQLQTIQYMLKFGEEQGEKIGKEMLESLKKRVNYLE